jgi:hypothetical protein
MRVNNRRNSTEMTRTFGIEIEGFGLPYEAVAEAITAAGVTCRYEGYSHRTTTYWKVVSDASIQERNGFEVVSPILQGPEGLAQVRTVMDALTAAGAKVNKGTGLHVHIGAAEFSLAEIRNIAKNYLLFEDFFDAIMPPSRRANENIYIRSNRGVFGAYDNPAAQRGVDRLNACTTIDEIVKTLHPGANRGSDYGRYFKLNLVSYWKHGTIEFRQHSGTVDADKALNWITLLMQFVNRAAVTRQRPGKNTLLKTPAGRLFHAFFRTFQIEGKEYFRGRRDMLHPVERGEIAPSSTMRRLSPR